MSNSNDENLLIVLSKCQFLIIQLHWWERGRWWFVQCLEYQSSSLTGAHWTVPWHKIELSNFLCFKGCFHSHYYNSIPLEISTILGGYCSHISSTFTPMQPSVFDSLWAQLRNCMDFKEIVVLFVVVICACAYDIEPLMAWSVKLT